jgi:hypothetical protein
LYFVMLFMLFAFSGTQKFTFIYFQFWWSKNFSSGFWCSQ